MVCKPSGISRIDDDDDDDDDDCCIAYSDGLDFDIYPHGSKFDSCWDPTLGKPGTDGSFNFGIFGKPAKYQELHMDCK